MSIAKKGYNNSNLDPKPQLQSKTIGTEGAFAHAPCWDTKYQHY